MPIQKSSAIVIRHHPLGEHDKLVSFYTSEMGKLKAVARSARRPGNRLTGCLDLLNYGELVFFDRPHKDLQYVNAFDVHDSFPSLKANLTHVAYGFYIAELVDQFMPERDADPQVFQLLLRVLRALDTTSSPALWVHAFELKLLTLMGIAPKLNDCVVCGGPALGSRLSLDLKLGGVLCGRCGVYPRDAGVAPGKWVLRERGLAPTNAPPTFMTLSRGTWRLMQQMQRTPWRELEQYRLSSLNQKELERTLRWVILYHLEKPLKSLAFLENVRVGDR